VNRKIRRYCQKCGDQIFDGEIWERPSAGDEIKTDEVGKYFDGAGRCAKCGRELCEHCGKFIGNVCKECRKEDDE